MNFLYIEITVWSIIFIFTQRSVILWIFLQSLKNSLFEDFKGQLILQLLTYSFQQALLSLVRTKGLLLFFLNLYIRINNFLVLKKRVSCFCIIIFVASGQTEKVRQYIFICGRKRPWSGFLKTRACNWFGAQHFLLRIINLFHCGKINRIKVDTFQGIAELCRSTEFFEVLPFGTSLGFILCSNFFFS